MSIECKDITKQFGSTRALDQVSLTLEPGHIYGLLGNNGAGKSTLLSILTDRQLPDQGTVTVDGQPVRNNDAALHKVFMVGEQNFFPEDMKIKRALHTMTYFYPDFDLRRAHPQTSGSPRPARLPAGRKTEATKYARGCAGYTPAGTASARSPAARIR